MGIFGHIYVQNLTVKNRQKWGDELVSRINSKKKQPKPASITFHTDEIQWLENTLRPRYGLLPKG